ncbi:hypothetical protein HYF16_004708 [Salmonella enterica]|nr:hypothetical protein [Salmonella enterica]EHF6859941.1 hypothetical protein [Salmonella enterica subsp. enterica serovar Panama]
MKRGNTLLTKTGILVSLVLLSPGVMSAESLNFNYTRADSFSLDPRLSLQAKACHSKGDPIVLNFRVRGILAGSGSDPGLQIRLKVRGEAYEKSFDVFSAPGATSSRVKLTARNTGNDFQIPWSVSASGIVSGANGSIVGQGSIPEQVSYGDPFCFTDEPGFTNPIGYVNTYHYVPIYRSGPGGDEDLFRRLCNHPGHEYHGNVTEQDGGGQRYWPSSNKYPDYPLPAPDYIKRKVDAEKSDPDYNPLYNPHPYLTNTLFFRTRDVIPAVPANPHFQPSINDPGASFNDASVDRLNAIAADTYVVPLSTKDNVSTLLRDGNVSVILGNRNISSLSLILLLQYNDNVSAYKSYSFNWVRDSADSNVLHYQGKSGNLNIEAGKNDGSTDPYAAHQFYPTDDNGFFKGTLVNGLGLTQAYKDYVDNIMPLSLPSDIMGNINLVNTDGLIFTIEPGDSTVSNIDLGKASYSVRITGQPLKFAPLRVNGKVAVSAMQIRNACY